MVDTSINHPLLRELQEMGLLTSSSTPKTVGPYKTYCQTIGGDASGGTATLTQSCLSGGVLSAFAIPADGTTALNTTNLTALITDTHFTVDGTTLTFITDQSGKTILLTYAY